MAPESTPDPLREQARTIAELHRRAAADLTPQQALVHRMHRTLARPVSVLLVVLAALVWIAGNLLAARAGLRPLDRPPFPYLELALTALGALFTLVVLIVQAREAHHQERRSHLDLQANLLTEHKVSKVISLLEELRRDLPNVRDRRDAEAEKLQESADAHEAVQVLAESMQEDEAEEAAEESAAPGHLGRH